MKGRDFVTKSYATCATDQKSPAVASGIPTKRNAIRLTGPQSLTDRYKETNAVGTKKGGDDSNHGSTSKKVQEISARVAPYRSNRGENNKPSESSDD